jgi:hypothetical protein
MRHSLANTDWHDMLWKCPDCDNVPYRGHEIWLHEDEDHPSNDWTRQYIAHHMAVHDENCENMYGGNRNVLRFALKYPNAHRAVTEVHGPIQDLPLEHQYHIYESAGIPNHGIVLPPPPPEPEPEPEPEKPEFPNGLDYDPDDLSDV